MKLIEQTNGPADEKENNQQQAGNNSITSMDSNENSYDSTSNDKETNDISKLHETIKKNKELAVNGLHHQAKRMKINSISKFPAVSVGTNVILPVPDVDRSKGDSLTEIS